ncbi:uncharacterized protein CIMG_09724 [Coccidioides immitis RS]|uniref:CENP-V/GFA domain-containing protein n=1 Tax=Coccidioides immitis (strain RS) TaxID=246410 RepID=J3K305_COCIM|nr:uncharacterized protein CIMG_09724 [Coccidioides immitis RS]EAS28520.3 hypothetical protein CIMG_09724 [Coccidioides immitis RS]
MAGSSRPTSITGGCVCGAIRYTIHFTPDMNWPATKNATCQCTRCRKFTGSLVPQLLTVPTANIHPPLSSQPAYKAFQTPENPAGHRMFCSSCGSSIAYQNTNRAQDTEVYLGSLDEDVLCGRKGESTKTEWGDWPERIGGLGVDICKTQRHIWVENAIPGLTDGMRGQKWLKEPPEGKPFEGCDLAGLREKCEA